MQAWIICMVRLYVVVASYQKKRIKFVTTQRFAFSAAAAVKLEGLCYHKFYLFQAWQAQLKLSNVTANNCNNTAGRKNRTVSTQSEINCRHVSSVEWTS